MSTYESKERLEKHQKKKRKVTSSEPTAEDYAALRQHYTFLPPGSTSLSSVSSSASTTAETSYDNSNRRSASTDASLEKSSTWQTRMVARYHDHLDKTCVLANMTRVHHPHHQLGLRWRTKVEVQSGQGSKSCGNLHCPSILKNKTQDKTSATVADPLSSADVDDAIVKRYLQIDDEEEESEAREVERLAQLVPGMLLTDYIVPFTYSEHGAVQTQLVKLKLCAKCAPLLFLSQGNTKDPSLAARRARK